jgi:hypothetical protein
VIEEFGLEPLDAYLRRSEGFEGMGALDGFGHIDYNESQRWLK